MIAESLCSQQVYFLKIVCGDFAFRRKISMKISIPLIASVSVFSLVSCDDGGGGAHRIKELELEKSRLQKELTGVREELEKSRGGAATSSVNVANPIPADHSALPVGYESQVAEYKLELEKKFTQGRITVYPRTIFAGVEVKIASQPAQILSVPFYSFKDGEKWVPGVDVALLANRLNALMQTPVSPPPAETSRATTAPPSTNSNVPVGSGSTVNSVPQTTTPPATADSGVRINSQPPQTTAPKQSGETPIAQPNLGPGITLMGAGAGEDKANWKKVDGVNKPVLDLTKKPPLGADSE
jgi:hypothetical protein